MAGGRVDESHGVNVLGTPQTRGGAHCERVLNVTSLVAAASVPAPESREEQQLIGTPIRSRH
jgi:hypothetical protein